MAHTWNNSGFCIYCPNVHRTDGNARSTCSDGFTCAGDTTKANITLDINTMLRTERTGEGTAIYKEIGEGRLEFVSGTPCVTCVNGQPKDRHSICETMIWREKKSLDKSF